MSREPLHSFSIAAVAAGGDAGDPPPCWGSGEQQMQPRHRPHFAVVLVLVAVLTTLVTSSPGGAQQDPATESNQVAARRGLVSIDVDVLKAEDTAISSTLSDVKQNVDNQTAALQNASLAYDTAKLNLAAADAALADTQKQLDAINDKADSVVVNAFVNPPSESAFEALTSPSLEDATVRQQILDWQADSDAKLLDKYKVFQDRLKAEKATRRKAKDAADRAKSETQAALADTEAAVGQQA